MPEFRMPSINQVALSGRVTDEPEARQPETGPFHFAFSVAINRPYRDAEGIWQEETTIVPVRASGKLAEYTADRLAQGKAVFITGRLSASGLSAEALAKAGGANSAGVALEVLARHIQFLDQEKNVEEE